ncbi:MAG TPA: phosphomannomutase/phosphoglucomutase [Candidatus Limiplasma sp.]|nr:phosphomannomutase/phosphoglucomutase [Candidatus Limiplasma sp.]
MSDFHKFKSGSDIRGIAIGDGIVLSQDTVKRFGAAFTAFLAEKCALPANRVSVAVGRDSRLSGPALLKAACEGITAAGAKAFDCGMCTTPSMYMAILEPGFTPTGSIMMTASHHPWNINGMKFFTEAGGLGHDDIDRVIELASAMTAEDTQSATAAEIYPYIPLYRKHLETLIREGLGTDSKLPLAGLHVVVDAGNGAGGFYADMLQSLGASTDGSQFLEPDGKFPNHPPNPENAEAMDSLSMAVVKAKADLGVIFDADCDRAAIVDADGKEINRNRLIALISAILLQKNPGATIVTDSVTSSGLAAFIQEHGGVHYRYKRGYRNVIDEAKRLNEAGIDCPLAIETSGHAAMRENRFLDDGMYLVTYLIIRAMLLKRENKSLSSIINSLREPLESAEYRLKILVPDFRKAGEAVIETVLEQAAYRSDCHIAPDNREGVRISFDLFNGTNNGWLLLRLSVHDPVMPLNVESDEQGGNQVMLQALYDMLQPHTALDLTVLKTALAKRGE